MAVALCLQKLIDCKEQRGDEYSCLYHVVSYPVKGCICTRDNRLITVCKVYWHNPQKKQARQQRTILTNQIGLPVLLLLFFKIKALDMSLLASSAVASAIHPF